MGADQWFVKEAEASTRAGATWEFAAVRSSLQVWTGCFRLGFVVCPLSMSAQIHGVCDGPAWSVWKRGVETFASLPTLDSS